jgi:histone acetyltransferase (RNA polymerase elongator complex component)
MLRNGIVAGIRVSTRPDAVGSAEAAFLAAHGVTTVELGVQSLNDVVLRAAGRGHDASVVAPAVWSLKSVGCRVGIQLMPGLPKDTPATALATLQSALAMTPSFLRIYPTVVVAGTALANAYHAGEFIPWSLEQTIVTVKRMLHRSMQAGIPVMRIGLQHSADLAAPGTVVAGPYHPALGELVQSALWRDLLQLLSSGINIGPIVVRCHPQRVSAVIGQHRCNLEQLELTTGSVVRVIGDPACSPTELMLISPAAERSGNILKDVTYDDVD